MVAWWTMARAAHPGECHGLSIDAPAPDGSLPREAPVNLNQILAYLESDSNSGSSLDDGSGVVLDVNRQLVFVLNETGQFVLDALRSGLRNEDEIAASLAVAFGADPVETRQDVHAFLEDVRRAMLGARPSARAAR